MTQLLRLPNACAILLYILLSPALVVVEEVISALRRRKRTLKVDKIRLQYRTFHALSDSEKNEFDKYYEEMSKGNAWLLQVMARESSIQLTLQNALVIYEFLYPPLYELNFNSWRYPSAVWILGLVVKLLSIVLSAYSTFNGILVNMKFKSHVQRKPAGLMNYVITVLLVICHIIMATGIVFLLLGHKYNIFII